VSRISDQWLAFETERSQAQRETMASRQLAARGISDVRLLEAMRTVPRHFFVPSPLVDHAYEDRPLEIGCR